MLRWSTESEYNVGPNITAPQSRYLLLCCTHLMYLYTTNFGESKNFTPWNEGVNVGSNVKILNLFLHIRTQLFISFKMIPYTKKFGQSKILTHQGVQGVTLGSNVKILNLFLHIQTQLFISFKMIPYTGKFEQSKILTPWGSRGHCGVICQNFELIFVYLNSALH